MKKGITVILAMALMMVTLGCSAQSEQAEDAPEETQEIVEETESVEAGSAEQLSSTAQEEEAPAISEAKLLSSFREAYAQEEDYRELTDEEEIIIDCVLSEVEAYYTIQTGKALPDEIREQYKEWRSQQQPQTQQTTQQGTDQTTQQTQQTTQQGTDQTTQSTQQGTQQGGGQQSQQTGQTGTQQAQQPVQQSGTTNNVNPATGQQMYNGYATYEQYLAAIEADLRASGIETSKEQLAEKFPDPAGVNKDADNELTDQVVKQTWDDGYRIGGN